MTYQITEVCPLDDDRIGQSFTRSLPNVYETLACADKIALILNIAEDAKGYSDTFFRVDGLDAPSRERISDQLRNSWMDEGF